MCNFRLLNIPNLLTLLRVSLIPIMVIIFYMPFKFHYILAAVIFTFASLTDWLDGFLARRLGQETSFGAFCDPLADKLIVIIALMLLISKYNSLWVTLPAIIIVSREIIVSGLREWMAKIGLSSKVAVVYTAKIKTATQMISIILLLGSASNNYNILISDFGIVLLLISSVLTIWTMFLYLNNAWQDIK